MDVEVIGLIVTGLLAWTGLLVGLIKWLLGSYFSSLDGRLAASELMASRDQDRALELERRLAQDFVRREDCLRCHQGLENRLEKLNESVESLVRHLSRPEHL